MDQNVKQQIIEALNGTTNVLVTVSSNPSVDELAACIGLTLVLNKLDKHTTAVFSGKVPSTLEFLKPDETLEKNTDSLRDFIIALDKSKADKLRYKVEDKVVKIFITPYKTSISEKDLDFGQGDFNVSLILALGVHKREELDTAITSHGKILHDATIVCVNHDQVSNLGAINWQDAEASSLCEMVVDLAETLKPDNFDEQTATALLTGIVAQTDRFSNEKTSPRTMSLSAKLMAAGANQQLVASKLQTALNKDEVASSSSASSDGEEPDAVESSDGSLRITHHRNAAPEAEAKADADAAEESESAEETKPGELKLEHDAVAEAVSEGPDDEESANGALVEEPVEGETPAATAPEEKPAEPEVDPNAPKIHAVKSNPADHISANGELLDDEETDSPSLGGTLTANTQPEGLDPSTDELSLPTPVDAPILSHNEDDTAAEQPKQRPLKVPVLDAPEEPAAEPAVELTPPVPKENPVPPVAPALSPQEPANGALPPLNAAPSPAPAPMPPTLPPLQADESSPLTAVPAPAPSVPTPPVLTPLPPEPQDAQANGGLPSNLVPPDLGPPPEQTASGTPQPLAPPPVPPPFTGGFPPAGQTPLPPQPPATGSL